MDMEMEDYGFVEDADAELYPAYENEDVFQMLLHDVGEATPRTRRASTPHFTWTADATTTLNLGGNAGLPEAALSESTDFAPGAGNRGNANPGANYVQYEPEMEFMAGPVKDEVLDDVRDMKGNDCHLIHPNLTWAGPLHQFSHAPAMDYEDEMFVPEPMEYADSSPDPTATATSPPQPVNPDYNLVPAAFPAEEYAEPVQLQLDPPESGRASASAAGGAGRVDVKKPVQKAKKAVQKRRGVRAHMTEEERREFLKRRNREAVRNCRKRKRELITRLTEREAVLRKENQRMRLQIRLGTDKFKDEQSKAANELIKLMQQQLDTNPNPNAELKKLAIMYLALFCDVSGDPAYRLDRGEIPPKLVAEIFRYSYPTNYNKMYLWQNAQSDSYFKLETKGLWQQLVKALGLTPKQMAVLKERRKRVVEICQAVASTLEAIERLDNALKEHMKEPTNEALLKALCSILSPVKFAKLLIFFHTDPRTSELRSTIDERWDTFCKQFDKESDAEERKRQLQQESYPKYVPAEPESSPNGVEVEVDAEALKKERHRCTSSSMKELFEGPVESIAYYVSQLSAHDEAEMFDPNFKQGIRGVDQIIRYIRIFRNAFKNLRAKEQSFITRSNKNVARSRWTLSGEYNGKLPVPDSKKHATVTFTVIIAYKFEPNTSLVKQLVVSWAAFDLMRQIGVFHLNPALAQVKPKANIQAKAKSKPPPAESSPTPTASMSTEAAGEGKEEGEEGKEGRTSPTLEKKQMEKLTWSFLQMLQTGDAKLREDLVNKLLDDDCEWVDSNMGGHFAGKAVCLKYVERLRKRTPNITTSQHAMAFDIRNGKVFVDLLVKGVYKGALATKEKNFYFPASISVQINPDSQRITKAVLTWSAGSLMYQLADINSRLANNDAK